MEESARPSSLKATPARHGDLSEVAVAIVVEQEIGQRIVGDEDVGAAIAIIVRKGHAHAFADVLRGCRTRPKHR